MGIIPFPLCVELLNNLSLSPAEHTVHVTPKEDTVHILVPHILGEFLSADGVGQQAECNSLIQPP